MYSEEQPAELTPADVERRKELGDRVLDILYDLEENGEGDATYEDVNARLDPAVGAAGRHAEDDLRGAIAYLDRVGYVKTDEDDGTCALTQEGRYDSPALGGINSADAERMREMAAEPDVDAMAARFGAEEPAALIAEILGEEGWVPDMALHRNVSRPDLFLQDPAALRQLLYDAEEEGFVNMHKVKETHVAGQTVRKFAWYYTGAAETADEDGEQSPTDADGGAMGDASAVYRERVSNEDWEGALPA